jgi:hypothetical protein
MHAMAGRNNDGWLVDDLKFQNTDRILHRHPALPSLEKPKRSNPAARSGCTLYMQLTIRDTPPPHNISSIITEVQRRKRRRGCVAFAQPRDTDPFAMMPALVLLSLFAMSPLT